MIRFVPGLAGAVVAYVVLIFTSWIQSMPIRAAIFFGVYLFVAFAVDKAMTQYGGGKN